jgi:hypothetical protein
MREQADYRCPGSEALRWLEAALEHFREEEQPYLH